MRLFEEHERAQHLRFLLAVGLENECRRDFVEFTPERLDDIYRRDEQRRFAQLVSRRSIGHGEFVGCRDQETGWDGE